MEQYQSKFQKAITHTFYEKLSLKNREFLQKKAFEYKLSHQEVKQLIDITRDLELWDEGDLKDLWEDHPQKKVLLKRVRDRYEILRQKPNSYKNFAVKNIPQEQKFSFEVAKKEGFGLGLCPVASEKTRCCNLLTLDAVESCGFDCSYCSIQSFYNQNKITFDSDFANKLKNLQLDKNKTYHIGTGQSSDSLMWGNREGLLDTLFDFAKKNPNVILEFKTKSSNIDYLLNNDIPKNILLTWSLNTQTIIDNEEHLTASLDKRIESARKVANKGAKVGFHFHPIVEYENYLEEYQAIYERLLDEFDPSEVALVSFGTLTFIKPVIKQLRGRDFHTKITQMPFEDASGKSSYPESTKIEMFASAYKSFTPWHNKVFFYLCMEEHSLWEKTLGYHYATNNDFERDMISSYCKKLGIPYLFS
ncbi:Spore photoproduct lyase [hydrothermal vent metagenome]|uniref:Spore photoproduct lyase n=1 Tax=hydrothermal vent metagenome TaxID=652676 RepID=A0A1W1D1V0_9ZZZZ